MKQSSRECTYIILSGIIIFFHLCMPFFLRAKESINKIVASVSGEPITYYDVFINMHTKLKESGIHINNKDDIRLRRMEEMALNELIDGILIRQEASKYKVSITEQDIDSEMRKIARENKTSVDVLEQQIRMQGNSVAQFKENLRKNLLQQRMIATFVFRKIVVTVQEVEEYYKKHKKSFMTDSMYELSYIKLPTQKQAQEVKMRVTRSSTPFASIQKVYAKELGEDSVGSLSDMSFGELSEEWQRAIVEAKVGSVVGPIHVDDSYFVVYIARLNEGKPLPFEDVYTTIEGKIRDAKFSSQYKEFIDSLRSKADITIYQ